MTLLKDAMQYLLELKEPTVIEINGQNYSTRSLTHVKHPVPAPLRVNTLSGLCEYILSAFDAEAFSGILIHVVSPTEVVMVSNLMNDGQRETYVVANAMLPDFRFGQFIDIENFIISVQSCFVPNEDSAKILKLVGNIKDTNIKTFGDDGVTQSVTAKSGIATVDEVPVPNPINLAPFRTFIEVEQPESDFIIRIRKSDSRHTEPGLVCALFEADGGAWKIDAMANIRGYLEDRLNGVAGVVIID